MTTTSLEHQAASVALIDACRTFCSIEGTATDEQYTAFADQCAHIHSPAHATISDYAVALVLDSTEIRKPPIVEVTYHNLKLVFTVINGLISNQYIDGVNMSLSYHSFREIDPNTFIPLVDIEFTTQPWCVNKATKCCLSCYAFDAQILDKPLFFVRRPALAPAPAPADDAPPSADAKSDAMDDVSATEIDEEMSDFIFAFLNSGITNHITNSRTLTRYMRRFFKIATNDATDEPAEFLEYILTRPDVLCAGKKYSAANVEFRQPNTTLPTRQMNAVVAARIRQSTCDWTFFPVFSVAICADTGTLIEVEDLRQGIMLAGIKRVMFDAITSPTDTVIQHGTIEDNMRWGGWVLAYDAARAQFKLTMPSNESIYLKTRFAPQLDVLDAFFSKEKPELDDITSVIQCWIDDESDSISTMAEFLAKVKAERSVRMDFASFSTTDPFYAKCIYNGRPYHPKMLEFFICKSSTSYAPRMVYSALLSPDLTRLLGTFVPMNHLFGNELRDHLQLLRRARGLPTPAPAPARTVVVTGNRMVVAYPLEETQTTFPFELRDDTCFTPFFGHGTPVNVSMFDPAKHAVLCNTGWPSGVMHFKDLCIAVTVRMNAEHAFHGNLHWTYRGERYEFPEAERSARGIRNRLVDTALAGKWPGGEEPQAVWVVGEF